MRKAASVTILLICLVGGGLIIKLGVPQKPISSAVFLPENVLFYIHQQDFSKHSSIFFETSLGRTVRSFNVVELALDLGLSLNVVDIIREIQQLMLTEEADTLYDEFFSNGCSLALLHGSPNIDYGDYLRKNLVLFTEPVHSYRTLDLMIKRITPKYNISSTQYGKHIIYRIQRTADIMVTFVSVKGKTLFTLDERTLRSMLDRYDLQRNNFTENYFFTEFQKKNTRATLFSYLEVTPLIEHVTNLFNTGLANKTDFSSILKGFTSAILSYSKAGNSDKNTITMHYNANLVDKEILHFFQIPPEKDIHITTSPRDTLFYFWMNTFDIRRLWDLFVKSSNIDEVLLESIEENIALTAGLPFDNLLDLFGNRFHYILRKPSEVDPVPLPNFTLIFELTNADKAQSTLQQLFLLNEIPHGSDIYRDVPFTYWGNNMQTGLQPVYSIHDNYLFVSSSVKMQLDVISTMSEGNGLTTVYPFSSVGKELLLDNNSSTYVKVDGFVDFLKDFLSLGEAMFSRQNAEFEYQTKTFIYKILFPLLESLKMYSSVSSTGNFESGKVNLEIYLNPQVL
jgi:hypothetical protein